MSGHRDALERAVAVLGVLVAVQTLVLAYGLWFLSTVRQDLILNAKTESGERIVCLLVEPGELPGLC